MQTPTEGAVALQDFIQRRGHLRLHAACARRAVCAVDCDRRMVPLCAGPPRRWLAGAVQARLSYGLWARKLLPSVYHGNRALCLPALSTTAWQRRGRGRGLSGRAAGEGAPLDVGLERYPRVSDKGRTYMAAAASMLLRSVFFFGLGANAVK